MVREMEQTMRETAVGGEYQDSPQPYLPPDDLDAFFHECDRRHAADPEPEPDWEEHMAVMEQSRRGGVFGR